MRPIRVSEAPQNAPNSGNPQIGNGTKWNGMEHFFAWDPWIDVQGRPAYVRRPLW